MVKTNLLTSGHICGQGTKMPKMSRLRPLLATSAAGIRKTLKGRRDAGEAVLNRQA